MKILMEMLMRTQKQVRKVGVEVMIHALMLRWRIARIAEGTKTDESEDEIGPSEIHNQHLSPSQRSRPCPNISKDDSTTDVARRSQSFPSSPTSCSKISATLYAGALIFEVLFPGINIFLVCVFLIMLTAGYTI